jgi:hypothetical protein
MTRYEYKVVPAPRKGEKTRAAKTTPERFALALNTVMNDLGREGWDYVRADTLPCDERVGLTGKQTSFQNMLVFRRVIVAEATAPEAVPQAADPAEKRPLLLAEPPLAPAPALVWPTAAGPAPAVGPARLAAE